MFSPTSLEDLALLRETVELECKLAQGQNGQGEVPKDFWPTYSAMANTHGGVVLLGVREKDGVFSIAGIPNPAKVRADLFNNLNNPGKVSANLLTDADVQELALQGQTMLLVRIPQATRKQRPVFLNGQPLGHTYKRLNDGDRPCDEETVKRMLAEQVEDERDARILPGFGMGDIDGESLRIYRQMLKDERPGHPYLEQDDFDFMTSLRGWRRDRQTGQEGLTLAGLLMFGTWAAIQEAAPHYFVDYQERPEARAEPTWIDRLVPDGSWTGNLFEFYRRVYRKLVADLKVPFAVKDGQRQDDTPVHKALREALVNALVHADYTGRVSVLVVKRPDMFGFRNPGGLRLPIEQVIRGGESDCRNRILHQMFLLIGLGERGGSGMPRIYGGWRSQHWRPPLLSEKAEPEQTLLALHMADLLPDEVVQALRARWGARFDALDAHSRLILATAAMERTVSHSRLLELCDAHSHDLSVLLARLVRQGMLVSDGRARGTVYYLAGAALPTPEDVFSGPLLPAEGIASTIGSADSLPGGVPVEGSEHSQQSSEHSQLSSEHSQARQELRDAEGRLLSPLLDGPVLDDLVALAPGFLAELQARAAPARAGRLDMDQMQAVICAVCTGHYVTRAVLARLLDRSPDALRQTHISPMVRSGLLQLAFPSKPTHEQQAYKTGKP
ncbi:RNA-binding domain-containing protein [Acidovorax sp. JMULE5]|uniref:RNA-binding domain-containing protein n=1 Tax=Acidovorax sp. JMULE5 TaxID=2518343 RepID=UPI0015A31876|nr:RNA-binding domain-containing protein [Acidovorax sp. JMULE5]